ncbi:ATP-grasp domain-containing protein [Pseudalkalibacillus caeni]|nr:ATP-grasp domain-containing protein [Pseudalkalibacillus caeni]
MIILDKPYVSSFLIETLQQHQIPVLINNENLSLESKTLNEIEEERFFTAFKSALPPLLTNSENALSMIYKHLEGTELVKTTQILKDKAEFRKKTSQLYPDLYFKEVTRDQLTQINSKEINYPCILKPAVGFFSMGVYKIDNEKEWFAAIQQLEEEIAQVEGVYPDYVMDTAKFLIEQYIDGEEFAVDAYYDESGNPVILNVLKHLFAGDKDTSDRVYYTGKKVIQENKKAFLKELQAIGEIFELRNYPIHIEFRVTDRGQIFPIEINPLRFAGWCTTDIASYAFGINPYEYYLTNKAPDWDTILKNMEDRFYSITVADTSGVPQSEINSVDYEGFLSLYNKVLAFRKIDFKEYPVFAFVFAEMTEIEEMNRILELDLKEYIVE